MSQQNYTQQFLTDLFEDWNENQQSNFPLSMRQFCLDWAIPRSTFQGWLNKLDKQATTSLPADRFYTTPTTSAEPVTVKVESGVDKSTIDVLRMLASELAAISTDLDEILYKL